MSVRARWHNAVVEIDDSDPFADSAPPIVVPVRVHDAGLPIDLSGDDATLVARLSVNMKEQVALGVDCPIRWEDDASCHACPVSQAGNGTAAGSLCTLAVEQESILTMLAVRKHGHGQQGT